MPTRFKDFLDFASFLDQNFLSSFLFLVKKEVWAKMGQIEMHEISFSREVSKHEA